MAKKHWEMNVTSFSSEAVLASARVEGLNWMAALGAARQSIGEGGGVPAGASCTVTADGGVRVQDPVAQRVYHLRPIGAGEEPRLPTATKSAQEPSAMAYGSTPVAGRSAQEIAREGVSAVTSPTKKDTSVSYRPPAPTAAKESSTPKPATSSPPGDPPFKLQPLRARDREPTEQNPVTFRERTYVAPTGTPAPSIELMLRQEFAKIKERLGKDRSATYIAMAVFDHAWSKKPERPPVVVLDWKDWRGTDPQISFPLSSPSSRPSPKPRLSAEATKKGTGHTRIEKPKPSTASSPVNRSSASTLSTSSPSPPVSSDRSPPETREAAPKAPLDESPTEIAENKVAPAPAAASEAEAPAADATDPDPPSSGASDNLEALDRDFPIEPEWSLSDANSEDLRLDIAFERTQQLFSLRSPKEGLEYVIDLLEQLVPSAAFTGAIYDIDTNELRFVVVRGDGADGLQGRAVAANKGLFGAAAEIGAGSINIEQIETNGKFVAAIDGRDGLKVQSALYLPVTAEGRLLAVLQCLNRKGVGLFSDGDVEIATYICSQLAQFLGEARRSLVPSRVP